MNKTAKIKGNTDAEIRHAFHARHLHRTKARPDTLVIDELGLAHAKCRIDVAVINGCIHGYEIKSARDTLGRLDGQLKIYCQTLQKLTLVVATKHVDTVMGKLPKWCGLIEAREGPRGGISFHKIQNAAYNPDVNPFMVVHLLWRDEVKDLLKKKGFENRDLHGNRKRLYEMLCKNMNLNEITTSILGCMEQRKAWRDLPARE